MTRLRKQWRKVLSNYPTNTELEEMKLIGLIHEASFLLYGKVLDIQYMASVRLSRLMFDSWIEWVGFPKAHFSENVSFGG